MRHATAAEINVTPLVDVCLVLLIIMMVVTPLAEADVELPRAEEPERWPAEPERSKVTLRFGSPPVVVLDDDPGPLSPDALETLLRAIHSGSPRREIVVRADRRLTYGEVKKVLQTVQDAGFASVGLVAERNRPSERP
jgi:biopolymer transport protein TolR